MSSTLAARIVFALLIVAVAIASGREFWRWRDPALRDLLTESQRQRRVTGTIILLSVAALCLGGTFLPSPSPRLSIKVQAYEMVYWGVILLLGMTTPVIGYLELKETQRRLRAEQRRALATLVDESQALLKPGSPAISEEIQIIKSKINDE
ncbi:MAG: hypothetical protein P4L33_15340 [Capsulimonadaceae bacterium]|nr:hypothetical protein [Capsulimonadaceae bacterium]